MFSLLDILKRYREEKRRERERPGADSSFYPEDEARPGMAISVFTSIKREQAEQNYKDIAKAYDEAVEACRTVYRRDFSADAAALSMLRGVSEKLYGLLCVDTRESLKFSLSAYPRDTEFLYYHAVNVCLLSLEMALALKYDPGQAVDLGVAALLHDAGQAACLELINKPGMLSEDERAVVRHHPVNAAEMLSSIRNDFPALVGAVVSEHERVDGSGYPSHLKGDDIGEFARIIGLVDVYEALTHWRPYRPLFPPSEAVTVLCRDKGMFEYRLIKILIERFGVFPLGCVVRLNTKEIAEVVALNAQSPLRPVVCVMGNARGGSCSLREVNLASNSMLFIEECLSSAERKKS